MQDAQDIFGAPGVLPARALSAQCAMGSSGQTLGAQAMLAHLGALAMLGHNTGNKGHTWHTIILLGAVSMQGALIVPGVLAVVCCRVV